MADPPDVTVHGVLAFAMPAGTPRQQVRNCGLEQRVSLDLKRGVLPVLNSGFLSILNSGVLSILNSGFLSILNSGFRPILNCGFLLVNRPARFCQNSCLQGAADGS